MSRYEKIFAVITVVLIVLNVLALLLAPHQPTAQTPDQVLHVNDQTVDLHGAQSVMIQSSKAESYFEADETSGAVTVTTSIVTVTIWMGK